MFSFLFTLHAVNQYFSIIFDIYGIFVFPSCVVFCDAFQLIIKDRWRNLLVQNFGRIWILPTFGLLRSAISFIHSQTYSSESGRKNCWHTKVLANTTQTNQLCRTCTLWIGNLQYSKVIFFVPCYICSFTKFYFLCFLQQDHKFLAWKSSLTWDTSCTLLCFDTCFKAEVNTGASSRSWIAKRYLICLKNWSAFMNLSIIAFLTCQTEIRTELVTFML